MKFNITIDGRIYTHSSSNDSARIGRTTESEFVLDHSEISKIHCLLDLISCSGVHECEIPHPSMASLKDTSR